MSPSAFNRFTRTTEAFPPSEFPLCHASAYPDLSARDAKCVAHYMRELERSYYPKLRSKQFQTPTDRSRKAIAAALKLSQLPESTTNYSMIRWELLMTILQPNQCESTSHLLDRPSRLSLEKYPLLSPMSNYTHSSAERATVAFTTGPSENIRRMQWEFGFVLIKSAQ